MLPYRPERQLHVLYFETPIQQRDHDGFGDGLTVFGRVVPYGEVIDFYDHADGKVKREMFRRGAFTDIARAWHRVMLNFAHLDGFQNMIGYGRKLVETEAGADATFKLYPETASKALEMMRTTHGGLSLEFYPLGPLVLDGDVIVRTKVHVEKVSIVTDPAYQGARVLALRDTRGAENFSLRDGYIPDDNGDDDEPEPHRPVSSSGTPLLDQVLAAQSVYEAQRSVHGNTSLPVANRDHGWDGDAAKSRIFAWAGEPPSAAKLGQAFLYRDDTMDATAKGAWKLPVADVIDGRLTLVPKGVFAAAAAVQGARGGTDLAGDLSGVRSRLSTLYGRLRTALDDDSITPPWSRR